MAANEKIAVTRTNNKTGDKEQVEMTFHEVNLAILGEIRDELTRIANALEAKKNE